ncbi:hypothetical protein E2320_021013 [Naja naja]|nr:hypothetical protein E2320_021013 [Naja naja]
MVIPKTTEALREDGTPFSPSILSSPSNHKAQFNSNSLFQKIVLRFPPWGKTRKGGLKWRQSLFPSLTHYSLAQRDIKWLLRRPRTQHSQVPCRVEAVPRADYQ